jgi:hypothetical protein
MPTRQVPSRSARKTEGSLIKAPLIADQFEQRLVEELIADVRNPSRFLCRRRARRGEPPPQI